MQQATAYALGSSQSELDRLRRQADTLHAEANWLFDRLDIQEGWRVLDMGCGPRGVLDQLSARVGPAGSVVGLDASEVMVAQARAFVEAGERRNIEIVHGVATDTRLPRGSFDMVHARLLLVNLPPPAIPRVLSEMVALLKPGGVLAVQDIDAGPWSCDPPHAAWDKLVAAFKGVVGEGDIGRRLPRMLREAGARNVKSHAHAMFCPPGHLWRYLPIQFTDATRGRAIQLGLATAEELDAAKAALQEHLDDPATTVLAPVVTQAWAHKSASPS